MIVRNMDGYYDKGNKRTKKEEELWKKFEYRDHQYLFNKLNSRKNLNDSDEE